nr:MAG TPA: hypothetical protein [Caudoviricetes sp.]
MLYNFLHKNSSQKQRKNCKNIDFFSIFYLTYSL